jgi:hypothetical protein
MGQHCIHLFLYYIFDQSIQMCIHSWNKISKLYTTFFQLYSLHLQCNYFNAMYSCIAILSKQKCHFFFFYKNGEQESRIGSVWVVGSSWTGEDMGRGCRRVNTVQILCTHVYKWRNETCWNYSRNVGKNDKGEL